MPSKQNSEIIKSINATFELLEIKDGSVLSFHHHLRNGDQALNLVLEVAAEHGLKDLGVAASSIFPVHAPLCKHIENGVATRLWAGYINGPVGESVMQGKLPYPAIIQSHGGRAQAFETNRLDVDVAFIAAPLGDQLGNLTGKVGKNSFGPMGYAMVDAQFAKNKVALVEEVTETDLIDPTIPSDQIDYIVKVPSIGERSGILSGTTKPAADQSTLTIAHQITQVIQASGLLKNGFSFQTGAGGISLACIKMIGDLMQKEQIKGGFISGGICLDHVRLLENDIFEKIFDVQCFDPDAVQSLKINPNHVEMSARQYASPLCTENIADQLDVAILGASEIDLNFNVNVTTAGNGQIIGGPGGHPDVSEGAKLTIIATRLNGGGFAKIVDQVRTITTKGEDVDVLVTDQGIAVHPKHKQLQDKLLSHGLNVVTISELAKQSSENASKHTISAQRNNPIVATIENRHGQIIDHIHKI